jgi:hypothetical protein
MHYFERVAEMLQLLMVEVGDVDGKSVDQKSPVWCSEIYETLSDVFVFHPR